MSQKVAISIADEVYDQINSLMINKGKTNRSEFVEELIRLGLDVYNQKEGDINDKKTNIQQTACAGC